MSGDAIFRTVQMVRFDRRRDSLLHIELDTAEAQRVLGRLAEKLDARAQRKII